MKKRRTKLLLLRLQTHHLSRKQRVGTKGKEKERVKLNFRKMKGEHHIVVSSIQTQMGVRGARIVSFRIRLRRSQCWTSLPPCHEHDRSHPRRATREMARVPPKMGEKGKHSRKTLLPHRRRRCTVSSFSLVLALLVTSAGLHMNLCHRMQRHLLMVRRRVVRKERGRPLRRPPLLPMTCDAHPAPAPVRARDRGILIVVRLRRQMMRIREGVRTRTSDGGWMMGGICLDRVNTRWFSTRDSTSCHIEERRA